MEARDGTRRYSGYDEYEGIFGVLGSSAHTTDRSGTRSLASKYGRVASRHSDSASGVHARGFPSSRRAASSTRRTGSELSTNGYERRERYLSERTSKRRLKPVDGDGLDDELDRGALAETPRPQQQQIWLPTKNFTFRQRAGKLDTRTIARLDLQKIVATTDVETIQRHLENVAFSDVTLEDVQQYSDAYFLKLFQIAQLTLEYLLNVQDSLASHCENLETQCSGLVDECQSLETENHKVEGEIVVLRKEIRQKQSTLATFEVMLLNATTAKRGSQGLRAMQQQKILDQENDPAVLNIVGAASANLDEESGAVPLVSSCVLCGKKFVSPEYLVRHQHKKHSDASKHSKASKTKKHDTSASEDSSCSDSGSDKTKTNGSDKTKTKTKKKRRSPQTEPLPAEVMQALNDRNELSKQLLELQYQLQSDKEKRAADATQAERQQAQLASQLTNYMATLQATLVDMEKKQEQSKHEMMRYTQEAVERGRQETAKKASHAGRLESDDDTNDRDVSDRKKGVSPEEVEKRILDSLLRAQADIHHKNAELEQTNRKLQTKLRRKTRQLQLEPQPTATALMSMAAMDAQRFGTNLGLLDSEEKPHRAAPKPRVAVEDKPVQTDEELDKKKQTATLSQQVQTDKTPVKETILAKPEPKPIVQEPPPPVKKQESKIPRVSKAIPMKLQTLTPTPEIKPVVEIQSPPPVAPKASVVVAAETNPTESKLQHAAHVVGKMALGFLTRKTLQNPCNWLIALPRVSLSHALSVQELETLTRSQGGQLQDVTVEIEADMTANDLRVAFAEALSGDTRGQEQEVSIDYHRILLHHRHTGQEIRGDQAIHHMRTQLNVEIIPSFEAAETHVDHLLSSHKDTSNRLHAIRRASIELFAPDELSQSLRIQNREHLAIRAAVRVQAIVRRFLAIRAVEMIKIDRLVEARLVAMRSLAASPQSRSSSSAFCDQRRVTRSASVAAIQEGLADETVVTEQAERIHARLADLVKQKTGIDTRTKSAKWSRGQLSTVDYACHVEEMEQNRATMAPEVQQRIAEISARVEKLLTETYDPFMAKQEEVEYVAASRIQLAVQVAVARKKLMQLLGRKEEEIKPKVESPEPTAMQDMQSVSLSDDSESEKAIDDDEEEKEMDEPKQDDNDTAQLDTEELDDDVDIKRLADAYEHAAASKGTAVSTPATPQPEPKPASVEAKPTVDAKSTTLPPRAGTPPPSREDLLGRSPRPKGDAAHVISPFSSTPLLSRRAATTRRGSGYDNAR